MSRDFQTDDHYALSRATSDVLIEVIADRTVAEKLRKLRDAIWPEPGKELPKELLRRVFHNALENISPQQKTLLLEEYARLGHINEITGLAARAHYFDGLSQSGKKIPGGVEEFVTHETSASETVAKLNQPVFEVVMTMHPTNTNSLEFMRAQRRLGKALESGDEAEVRAAIVEFEHVPILHTSNGQDVNFTVRDETQVVLNYLGNIYDDLPRIYAQYDQALGSKFKGQYTPEDLQLSIHFGSWGSAGDKDGNNSVTAEMTLEAIALHTQAIVARYYEDMKELSSPALQPFKEQLDGTRQELSGLLPKIEKLRVSTSHNVVVHDQAFDKLSARLAGVRSHIDVPAFEQALVTTYQKSQGKEKDAALDVLRKLRMFGLNFSKIEYRETAKEYGRVVAELVDGYAHLSPSQRAEKLTALLTAEGNKPQALLQAAKQKILSGAMHPYSESDALPIAYHTLKRMELARDFPDMIKDNVLAECGQTENGASPDTVNAQGVANILEAQFVQRMAEKEGKRPSLGIVPLFEEPATMMQIDTIMRKVYENPAYQQHLDASKKDGQPVQQVQIAHSDNARRSGLQAARAFIHEAHKKMRALNDEFGIKTQFFEGGSISDAYRNGVRAVSASVNAFGLQDFAKFTFQGGDLVNYFSLPSSNERLFTRNIVHSAARFENNEGKWQLRRRSDERGDALPERIDRRVPNPVLDDIAIAALKATLADYQKDDFTPNAMGVMLAALDYDGETKAGNRGSRAAKRGPVTFTKTNGVHAGSFMPVDIERIRTIAFSEAFQHAGIVPSWLGSQQLEKHLREEAYKRKNELPDNFGEVHSNTPLAPQQVQLIYEKSPTFRDAQDRSAFALAMTDPEAFKWIGRKISNQDAGDHSGAKAYLGRIKETYRSAGKLAVAALRGEEGNGTVDPKTLAESLERMTGDIGSKVRYRDFLLYAKIDATRNAAAPNLDDHQRGIVHNAGDTVVHGRFPTADDPSYGESRTKKMALAVSRSTI